MTVKSNKGESITFDHMHLSSFSLVQSETTGAKKKVTVICKRYGFDKNSDKVFDSKEIILNFSDFDEMVTEMLVAHHKIAVEDLPAQPAASITKVNGFNILDSMKAFEVGLGELLDYKGLFEYDSIL